MCPTAPGKVVVYEKPRGASSLDPGVVESSDCCECIWTGAVEHDGKGGEGLLKVRGPKQTLVPRKPRVEVVHKVLRKDVGISRRKRVQGLRGERVEQRIDWICIGSLESGVRLKAKPGGIFLIAVVIDA